MQDYGSNSSRAQYLENAGRAREAAEAYIQENQVDEAVRVSLALKDRKAQKVSARAVLDCLWSRCYYGSAESIVHDKTEEIDLLLLASKIEKSAISSSECDIEGRIVRKYAATIF